MEVTYKIRPRDLMRNRVYLFNTSVLGKAVFLIWLLSPFVMSGTIFHWMRGVNPITHPFAVWKQMGQGALIGWLLSSTIPYVLAALSNMFNSISINSYGFPVTTKSSSNKPVSAWHQAKVVEEDSCYIYFHRFWYAIAIPKDAFPSSAEAETFFNTALAYWRETKGIAPPPAPDVSGIWPPAPRAIDSSQKFGDKP